MNNSSEDKLLPVLASYSGNFIMSGSAFVAMVIFIGQIFWWLYSGSWHPLPISMFIPEGSGFESWLLNPQSWAGLSKIISWIFKANIAFSILIIGLVVGGTLYANGDENYGTY